MTEIILVAVACLMLGAAAGGGIVFLLLRRAPEADPETDALVADLARQHGDTAARLEGMINLLAKGQSQLQHTVAERLDAVSHRMHQSMSTTTQQTVERLQGLHERLAVIDRAQKNITDLSSQVTSLHSVLGNKQQRGAFGQGRMEIIIRDG